MNSMTPISSLALGAAQAAGVKETPKVQRPESKPLEQPQKPVMDEYIPEEKREPSGRYWLGRDGEGQPKVFFDDPERAADASERPENAPAAEEPGRDKGPAGPERKGGGKAEMCRGSTDAVDREIERLKKRREKLEQQIGGETDESKLKKLKQELAQVERELAQKDNDTYRRQHTVFS